MRESSINPVPENRQEMVITHLGPNLSLNFPVMILKNPEISAEMDMAPEVIARVQPNSVSSGSKKTPKLACDTLPMTIIQKPRNTMIYP